MLCEADHFPELREALARNPRRLRRVLVEYLKRQMERGRVRPFPPEAMAHVFWGMLFSYGISVEILDEPILPEEPVEQVVARFVEVFITGTEQQET
jgi:hypothetical protein